MSLDGWRDLDPMSVERRCAQGVSIDDQFLVIGGQPLDGRIRASCELCDAGADPPAWRPFPSMPSGRRHCGAATVGGKVYVMGGYGGPKGCELLGDLVSIDVSGDPSTLEGRRWEALAPTKPRLQHACVADADEESPCIYVLGGYGEGGRHLDTAEKYDIGTDTWESLPRMPEKRWGHAAGKVGNKIYVVGGRDENNNPLSSTLVFDTSSGRWDSGPDMKAKRAFLSVVVVGDRVVAIGGDDDADGGGGTIEVLDTRRNSWVESRARTKYSGFYSTAGFLSGRNEIIVAGTNDYAGFGSIPFEEILS